VVATAAGEKTPHRVPPCEELTGRKISSLFLCRKLHLFFGKSTKKLLPPELHVLTQICTKSFVGWGFAPDLTGGAYSAPPNPLAVFRGSTSKGRGEKRRGGSSSFAIQRKKKSRRLSITMSIVSNTSV